MISKINVWKIIVDHISTLNDHKTKKILRSDILLFFVYPIVAAGLILWLCDSMRPSLVSVLSTSLSIFAALLFNLLLLVYSAIRKDEQLNSKSRKEFLKEIYVNISFCILISVISIVLILVYSQIPNNQIAQYTFSFLIYYFVIVFVLTLLMVLKRIHVLFSKEIDR